MLTRKMTLAFAVSLVLMLCGASFAQERDHDRQHQQSSRDRHNDHAREHSYRTPDRHQDGYHGNGQYGRYPNVPYRGSGNGTYAHSPYYGNGQYGGYSTAPYNGYGNGGYSPYYGYGQYSGYPYGQYGGYGNGPYGNGPYGTYGQYGNYGGNAQSYAYNNGTATATVRPTAARTGTATVATTPPWATSRRTEVRSSKASWPATNEATTRVLAVATDVAKKIPIEKGAQRSAFFFSGLLRTGS